MKLLKTEMKNPELKRKTNKNLWTKTQQFNYNTQEM